MCCQDVNVEIEDCFRETSNFLLLQFSTCMRYGNSKGAAESAFLELRATKSNYNVVFEKFRDQFPAVPSNGTRIDCITRCMFVNKCYGVLWNSVNYTCNFVIGDDDRFLLGSPPTVSNENNISLHGFVFKCYQQEDSFIYRISVIGISLMFIFFVFSSSSLAGLTKITDESELKKSGEIKSAKFLDSNDISEKMRLLLTESCNVGPKFSCWNAS